MEKFYEAVAEASEELGEGLDSSWLYQGADPLAVRDAIMRKDECIPHFLAFCMAACLFGTKSVQDGKFSAKKAKNFSAEVPKVNISWLQSPNPKTLAPRRRALNTT